MELSIARAQPADSPLGRPGEAQLLDLKHLGHQTLGDPELRRVVLRLFLDESPRYAADLAAARDDRAWRMAVHTLKGVALNIGAFRLAQLCKAHEAPVFGAGRASMSSGAGALAAMIQATARTILDTLADEAA